MTKQYNKKKINPKKDYSQLKELKLKIEKLENELVNQKEIAQKAQSDYFRYKVDMDAYMLRSEEAKKSSYIDAIIIIGGKMLPFVTHLKQSLEHIPEELMKNPWVEGISIIYKKVLGDLKFLGIFPINTKIGDDPNLTLHIPLNTQETDNEKMKGKIIQEIETGWKYEKDGIMRVITPTKIIVGS